MHDRELVDAVIEGTLPKIKDIRDAVMAEVEAEVAAGKRPELEGRPRASCDPELEKPLARALWGPPLHDATVHLLWAILDKAPAGTFVADEASVAEARVAVDPDALRRSTGFGEHAAPIMERICETFLEVVRAHGTIALEIDGQPVRLVART